ncbi:hypothetical protein GZH46_00683 [Fragariocoptes setiger]|uniref:Uncharacterized protein n=1 Tax=Fragariocoptes setiger TaxID=1670756 RepID=A0ABQ7SBI0_9ACAR|nr:hypothetical protein GZH46_00683 [Fragariocoptes setiger]
MQAEDASSSSMSGLTHTDASTSIPAIDGLLAANHSSGVIVSHSARGSYPMTNSDYVKHSKGSHGDFYEAAIFDLRSLTNYTFEVHAERFRNEPPNNKQHIEEMSGSKRLNSGRTISMQEPDTKKLRIETKGFGAEASRCLANISEVIIKTGKYFAGKIGVENANDPRCSVYGDKSSPLSTYRLTILHDVCGSRVIDNTRIETMVLVHEHERVLTHNAGRFLVVCNSPKSFTLRASVSVPQVNGIATRTRPATISTVHRDNHHGHHRAKSGSLTATHPPLAFKFDGMPVNLGMLSGKYRTHSSLAHARQTQNHDLTIVNSSTNGLLAKSGHASIGDRHEAISSDSLIPRSALMQHPSTDAPNPLTNDLFSDSHAMGYDPAHLIRSDLHLHNKTHPARTMRLLPTIAGGPATIEMLVPINHKMYDKDETAAIPSDTHNRNLAANEVNGPSQQFDGNIGASTTIINNHKPQAAAKSASRTVKSATVMFEPELERVTQVKAITPVTINSTETHENMYAISGRYSGRQSKSMSLLTVPGNADELGETRHKDYFPPHGIPSVPLASTMPAFDDVKDTTPAVTTASSDFINDIAEQIPSVPPTTRSLEIINDNNNRNGGTSHTDARWPRSNDSHKWRFRQSKSNRDDFLDHYDDNNQLFDGDASSRRNYSRHLNETNFIFYVALLVAASGFVGCLVATSWFMLSVPHVKTGTLRRWTNPDAFSIMSSTDYVDYSPTVRQSQMRNLSTSTHNLKTSSLVRLLDTRNHDQDHEAAISYISSPEHSRAFDVHPRSNLQRWTQTQSLLSHSSRCPDLADQHRCEVRNNGKQIIVDSSKLGESYA